MKKREQDNSFTWVVLVVSYAGRIGNGLMTSGDRLNGSTKSRPDLVHILKAGHLNPI